MAAWDTAKLTSEERPKELRPDWVRNQGCLVWIADPVQRLHVDVEPKRILLFRFT